MASEKTECERRTLLRLLGDLNRPLFPHEIRERMSISTSRVYTLVNHPWFVNEQYGRNLSELGRAEYDKEK
jgi:hypothetical protein